MSDEQGKMTYWNRGAEYLFGYSPDEVLGRPLTLILPERHHQDYHEDMAHHIAGGLTGRLNKTKELEGCKKDGAEFPMELSFDKWEKTGQIQFTCIIRDITERKETEHALRESEERYRRLIELSPDAIVVVFNGRLVFANTQAVQLMAAKDEGDLISRDILSFVHPDHKENALRSLSGILTDAQPINRMEGVYMRLDGRPIDVEVNASLIPYEDSTGVMVVVRDISARKQAEQELQQANEALAILALRDGLTGIVNRRHFDERVETEWSRAARELTPLAVLMCDIDCFKAYNDTYGHLVGDSCLKQVATAIDAEARRPGDLAARYGGEEFIMLLPNTAAEGALAVAQRMKQAVEALRIPHARSNAGPFVTVSIGVGIVVPSPGCAARELIDQADKALYQAKVEGRNRVVLADSNSSVMTPQ